MPKVYSIGRVSPSPIRLLTMATPANTTNGEDNIAPLIRTQTSRFRSEWKENVLCLGTCEECEIV